MAFLHKRGNIYHIYYYDFRSKSRTSISTCLRVDERNLQKAEKLCRDFGQKLLKRRINSQYLSKIGESLYDAKQHFLNTKIERSPQTLRQYSRMFSNLELFFDFNKSSSSEINKISVEKLLISLHQKGLQRTTISTYTRHILHFVKFLQEYEFIPSFIINMSLRPKMVLIQKIIFTEQNLLTIYENLAGEDDILYTVINLLIYTGLRPNDIFSLKWQDIELQNRLMRIVFSKTNTFREIPFHNNLYEILLSAKGSKAIGRVVDWKNSEVLCFRVNRFLKKIGLYETKKCTAYTFRKTFITRARYFGMDSTVIKELVGHSHSNTLDRYYTSLGLDYLRKELAKYQPPGVVDQYSH